MKITYRIIKYECMGLQVRFETDGEDKYHFCPVCEKPIKQCKGYQKSQGNK